MSAKEDDWDDRLATDLEGATVIVGLTWVDPTAPRLEQMHGTIMTADRGGVALRLEGERAGEWFNLPPDLQAFERAAPGRYTLRGTGEIVDDPDFTASWTVTPPVN